MGRQTCGCRPRFPRCSVATKRGRKEPQHNPIASAYYAGTRRSKGIMQTPSAARRLGARGPRSRPRTMAKGHLAPFGRGSDDEPRAQFTVNFRSITRANRTCFRSSGRHCAISSIDQGPAWDEVKTFDCRAPISAPGFYASFTHGLQYEHPGAIRAMAAPHTSRARRSVVSARREPGKEAFRQAAPFDNSRYSQQASRLAPGSEVRGRVRTSMASLSCGLAQCSDWRSHLNPWSLAYGVEEVRAVFSWKSASRRY